eukprot:3937292-Rhodomonas_salina.2
MTPCLSRTCWWSKEKSRWTRSRCADRCPGVPSCCSGTPSPRAPRTNQSLCRDPSRSRELQSRSETNGSRCAGTAPPGFASACPSRRLAP